MRTENFLRAIDASRPIKSLLYLRNAATLTLFAREYSRESAEQAGLRRRSTARQQERGSRRFFLVQVCQDLLDDHRVFDAGNGLGCTSADTARVNVDIA